MWRSMCTLGVLGRIHRQREEREETLVSRTQGAWELER